MIAPLLRAGAVALACTLALGTIAPTTALAAVDCKPAPQPILTLAFGSRYADAGQGSTELDEDNSANVDNALRPVDDFLRDLTDLANSVHGAGADAPAVANCVLDQIAVWAEANALADLRKNARLTIGSRLAGFGLVMLQVVPHAEQHRKLEVIRDWLDLRMTDQMLYWEAEAPDGASRGNLRAWAALAGATIGTVADDPVIRGWAAWSASYVICTANPDGSLPQEMTRGKFALHYQLHAIAPLTVSAALLSRSGFDLTSRCDHALNRIVMFAVNDLDTGAATAQIAGEKQSFFDGTDKLEGWQLSWLEAYLTIHFDPGLITLAEQYRPLSYSKLGGDQTVMWAQMRW